ncbi:unnamed protein product, partial [Chrysoparadoxa australica]
MQEELLVIGFGASVAALAILWFVRKVKALRKPNQPDPDSIRVEVCLSQEAKTQVFESGAKGKHHVEDKGCSFLMVPSAKHAELLKQHISVKRVQLKLQADHDKGSWAGKWTLMDLPSKLHLVREVRENLLYALSTYIGYDELLLCTICPELQLEELVRPRAKGQGRGRARPLDGLTWLVESCSLGRLPEPHSQGVAARLRREGRGYSEVSRAVNEAVLQRQAPGLSHRASKAEIRIMATFLTSFRQLCLYSFATRCLEDIAGRANVKAKHGDKEGERSWGNALLSLLGT